MSRTFKKLEYADRQNIARWLTEGASAYNIAARLSVTPPTVYREIRRGICDERDAAGRLIYDPVLAESKTRQGRQNSARKPRPIVGRIDSAEK